MAPYLLERHARGELSNYVALCSYLVPRSLGTVLLFSPGLFIGGGLRLQKFLPVGDAIRFAIVRRA